MPGGEKNSVCKVILVNEHTETRQIEPVRVAQGSPLKHHGHDPSTITGCAHLRGGWRTAHTAPGLHRSRHGCS